MSDLTKTLILAQYLAMLAYMQSPKLGYMYSMYVYLQWRRKVFWKGGGGAKKFARAPESAGPPLGAEGPPEADEVVLVTNGP